VPGYYHDEKEVCNLIEDQHQGAYVLEGSLKLVVDKDSLFRILYGLLAGVPTSSWRPHCPDPTLAPVFAAFVHLPLVRFYFSLRNRFLTLQARP